MAKSVGMITMYRKNYGAFFQAYALQKMLNELGYAPELIRYDYYREKSLFGIALSGIKYPWVFVKQLAAEILKHREHCVRQRVFDKSIQLHLKESKEYYKSYAALEMQPPVYDIYLTGSDQVFNGNLTPHAFKSRLLSFVKKGIKVSYAASAGDKSIPQTTLSCMQKELNQFQQVSVREEGLKRILTDVLDVPVEQHIDPALLLSAAEWEKFGESIKKEIGSYIFYYRVLAQKSLMEEAIRLSKQLGLPIFVADGNDRFEHQLKRDNVLTPEQWVGMLQAASYVVTNSFHGTAFSINFHKKAFVAIPPSGGARIEGLLKKCQAERLLSPHLIEDNQINTLYADADVYLAQERQRSIHYLKKLEHS